LKKRNHDIGEMKIWIFFNPLANLLFWVSKFSMEDQLDDLKRLLLYDNL